MPIYVERLGPWSAKRLQRLNYVLFALVIAHAFFYGALGRTPTPFPRVDTKGHRDDAARLPAYDRLPAPVLESTGHPAAVAVSGGFQLAAL